MINCSVIGLDAWTEEAVLLLEAALILSQEFIEIMEQHPIEDGPLRMSGTVDSRHGGRKISRNEPKSQIR
jgi:hypothetical protein